MRLEIAGKFLTAAAAAVLVLTGVAVIAPPATALDNGLARTPRWAGTTGTPSSVG